MRCREPNHARSLEGLDRSSLVAQRDASHRRRELVEAIVHCSLTSDGLRSSTVHMST